MRSESETPQSDNPFSIPVASRMRRLPPYLFGKINKLKYEKRVAGIDVIDLGMGNPTDEPEQIIRDKMAEAVLDTRNHRYSVSNGIAHLRKEVAHRYHRRYGVTLDHNDEVIATIGSKEGFSHMCLALMGPGDTVHLSPRVVHRITALTDVQFVEVSTAAPGWRDDVVRLSDRYGRTGTTAP